MYKNSVLRLIQSLYIKMNNKVSIFLRKQLECHLLDKQKTTSNNRMHKHFAHEIINNNDKIN